MNIYAISATINLVIFVFIGGVIWRRGKNRRLVNALGLFSLTLAIWSFGYLFWQLSNTASEALFWSRFLMMGAIFVTVAFFHFTLVFVNKIEYYKEYLYAGYALMTFFAIANYTDYFVSGVKEILSFPFWPQPGILFHPFLATWVFYAGFAVYLLYKTYRSAEPETQDKIWYLLAGIVITYIGGGANYFLWYDIKIPPVSTVSVSLFQILIAYAIAKHQLFNMKVVITEFISWLLVSMLMLNLILSPTNQALIKNGLVLALVAMFAYFMVRSVYKQVKSREKAEDLAEDLREANQELKFMDQQKSKMLSIASHQFRSPLTSIEGYTSLMKEGSYGEIPEHLEKPIDRILKSSKKLAHIVDDFLNISRIEDGRMNYNFQNASIKDIVKKVVEEAETTAANKDLDLQLTYDDDQSYKAKIDVGKFGQVITNLVDNAIKYTQEGEVTVSLDREGGDIIIEVTDTGIGLDPEDTEGIFEQFSRADEAEEVNVVGSGLGLYIAKEIVEAHNGEIWATSPGKGEGSTFHVKLTKADQSGLGSDDGEDESEVEIN